MSQAAIIRTGEGSSSKLRDLSAEMLANAINRGGHVILMLEHAWSRALVHFAWTKMV